MRTKKLVHLGTGAMLVAVSIAWASAAIGDGGPSCAGSPATLVGTSGDDVIQGTPGRDVIVGLGGNDLISGMGGDDVICGNGGNDAIRGGRGSDTIDGGAGDDRVLGGRGLDLQHGGVGHDISKGGPGLDILTDTPGRYLSPRVGLGTDRWLYLADEFTMPCANEIPHERIAETMADIASVITQSGRTSFMLLAPGKDAIHPEHLGTLAGDAACAAERRSEWRAALRAAGIDGWIDMWAVLRKRAATEDVYFPLDSHWTTIGALLATKQVVDGLDPGMFHWSDVSQRDARASGAEATSVGWERTTPVVVYKVDRGGGVEQTDTEGRLGPNTFRASAPDGVVATRLLVIHDSFGNPIEPMLNQFAEASTFVSWTVFAGQSDRLQAVAALIAAHDVIVFEHSERGAYHRFGVAYAGLAEALATAFAADAAR